MVNKRDTALTHSCLSLSSIDDSSLVARSRLVRVDCVIQAERSLSSTHCGRGRVSIRIRPGLETIRSSERPGHPHSARKDFWLPFWCHLFAKRSLHRPEHRLVAKNRNPHSGFDSALLPLSANHGALRQCDYGHRAHSRSGNAAGFACSHPYNGAQAEIARSPPRKSEPYAGCYTT